LRDRAEMETVAWSFKGTGVALFANMIEGGKTPILSNREIQEMGFAGVFWSCTSLYLVASALYRGFRTLVEEGTTDSLKGQMIEFSQFNRFVGLDVYRELERKYRVDRDD
ncbi:MAG: hypothetical protein MR428_07455, partial [Mesosutterella sp.]|nr:hypothetical protein [Mesosutterella sp.]